MLGQKVQLKVTVGLLTFYTIMVWAFSVSLDVPALIWILAGITPGRSLGLLRDPAESKHAIMARSGIGVILYLLVVTGTVFRPIPELGITGSVLSEVYADRGSGLWEAEPERAIAGAAAHFLLIGRAEITVLRSGGVKMSDHSND